MGNTFGPNGILDRLEPARLIVEVAEIVVHEGDEPDPVAHLLHPDVLAGKDLTQIDLPALVADPAAVGDGRRSSRAADSASSREAVVRARSTARRGRRAPSSPSAWCGRSWLKRSMKAIEPRLLLEDIGRGRLGGFGLQREMHALVAAVLLGMPGLDALDLNAEP